MMDQYNEAFDKLKDSPLFQLSLSSKELFHSNMIAWLSMKYSKQMTRVLGLKFDIVNVYREKGNIDLTFELSNDSTIMLENKVKSSPNLEQLVGYSGKNPGANGILLTLIEPTFELPDTLPWKVMKYCDLKKNMVSYLLETLKVNSYEYSLVVDYISFIENLDIICQKHKILGDNVPLLLSSDDRKKLQELRIQDLVEKQRASWLESEIREFLASERIASSPNPWKKPTKLIPKSVFTLHGLTHTLGLVESKVIKENGEVWTVLGIQLQGDQLRFVVECPRLSAAESAFSKYESTWIKPFCSQAIPSVASPKFKPAKHHNKKNFKYNQYKPGFLYDYVKLTPDTTVKNVLDVWKEAIKLALILP